MNVSCEPLQLISLGAGVQSSTMALMAARGEITPMPAAAIFADTQAEPPSVYRWLDWLEKQLPFPVHRVTAGDLGADVLRPRITADGRRYCRTNLPFFTVDNNTGEQGMVRMRSCTKDFKIRPIEKKVRELIGVAKIRAWHTEFQRRKRAALKAGIHAAIANPDNIVSVKVISPDILCVQWIGISLDEFQRAKPSRVKFIKNIHPLLERRITRRKCLEWMEAKRYPVPPRSACVFCPFHSDAEWQRLKREEPEQFEKAVQFEKAASVNFVSTPYLHRSCQTLDTIDFRSLEERGQQVFDWQDECEGMCGV